eukprot:gnl/Spiro4/7262_TR3798_c0_g1_i1.p1 gnl/Spiro4/7262_TR3798_c0_g1~~gnl/Spiro4/7262_TR3798_c0_g1_i1.p1  ORF type:complete len:550 (-),score=150.25 gnl/Spiro4/7262_TR3798_c0_g1_i1:119-1726(-)
MTVLVQQCMEDRRKLLDDLSKQNESLAQMEHESHEHMHVVQRLRAKLEAKSARLEHTAAELQAARVRIDELEDKLHEAETLSHLQENELQDLQHELDSCASKEAVDELRKYAEDLQTQLASQTALRAAADDRCSLLQDKCSALETRLEQEADAHLQLDRERCKLQEEINQNKHQQQQQQQPQQQQQQPQQQQQQQPHNILTPRGVSTPLSGPAVLFQDWPSTPNHNHPPVPATVDDVDALVRRHVASYDDSTFLLEWVRRGIYRYNDQLLKVRIENNALVVRAGDKSIPFDEFFRSVPHGPEWHQHKAAPPRPPATGNFHNNSHSHHHLHHQAAPAAHHNADKLHAGAVFRGGGVKHLSADAVSGGNKLHPRPGAGGGGFSSVVPRTPGVVASRRADPKMSEADSRKRRSQPTTTPPTAPTTTTAATITTTSTNAVATGSHSRPSRGVSHRISELAAPKPKKPPINQIPPRGGVSRVSHGPSAPVPTSRNSGSRAHTAPSTRQPVHHPTSSSSSSSSRPAVCGRRGLRRHRRRCK